MTQIRRLKTLVDGGYLSWAYGCKPGATMSWATVKGFYTRVFGTLVVMDSTGSVRKDFNRAYKARRAVTREDPAKQAKYEMVQRFQAQKLFGDPSIFTASVSGFEADDLVAAILIHYPHLFNRPLKLIGVDKDLWQLPWDRFRMVNIKGQPTNFNSMLKKFPKYISEAIKSPSDVLLGLSLFGDRSDSIPKLARRDVKTVVLDIFGSRRKFTAAYEIFGSNFLDNLYSAVLPHPFVYAKRPTPLVTLRYIDSGSYWNESFNPLSEVFLLEMDKVIHEFAT